MRPLTGRGVKCLQDASGQWAHSTGQCGFIRRLTQASGWPPHQGYVHFVTLTLISSVLLSSASAADGPSSHTLIDCVLVPARSEDSQTWQIKCRGYGSESGPRRIEKLHKQGWLLSSRPNASCDVPFVATGTCKEPPAGFMTHCLAESSRTMTAGCPLRGEWEKESVQSPTVVRDT